MVELLFLLSFLVELQSNCFHMNLESIIMKEGAIVISMLFKRPVSWLSFLVPPVLYVVGLGFSQILLMSTALFFSSFFFPLSIQKPNPLIDSKVQDHEQDQDNFLAHIEIPTTNEEIVRTNDEDEGTIPDEESLIELSLPSGHYVGHHFSTMAGHQDFRLIQLSAEFEDDNLIEIDISIGSIKCSGFQIKA
ncbi:hypothetical protein EUTSA_v10005712mg [Eutrema salsugineum]|uniref:CNNM transmembrane domain-containing protein n=1 Tax=Eutrema salsugineum TaxID=72664 RepID=V4KPI7_EUTSA|nr:uncharacterized protein LOC18012067 [Eutrema salsugineum]ESQ33214.1 hypothetical protein EUTSA_v10005712mg [Eutrema salsugineum]